MNELKKAGVLVPRLPIKDSLNFVPDLVVPKNIAWTHRSGDIGDVYFISNQENATRNFDAIFRNAKNKPAQWNPVTGEIETLKKTGGVDVKTRTKIKSDGVFVFIGMKPNIDLFRDKLELDKWGYIKTNEDMLTSMPGIYALGDVTSKKYRQITTAVADGTIAAIAIAKEINFQSN